MFIIENDFLTCLYIINFYPDYHKKNIFIYSGIEFINVFILVNHSLALKSNMRLNLKLRFAKFEKYKEWWLYLHNSYDIPSGYDWNAIKLSKGIQYFATYAVNMFQLLESPYPTNCQNYRKTSDY